MFRFVWFKYQTKVSEFDGTSVQRFEITSSSFASCVVSFVSYQTFDTSLELITFSGPVFKVKLLCKKTVKNATTKKTKIHCST